MMRLALAMVATAFFCGCQHSGQQAIDPFWGRTTVPAPATGAIGAPIVSPGYPQSGLQQPVITPGTPLTNGTAQGGTPPNLLPAPISASPTTPAAATPTLAPAMPATSPAPNYTTPIAPPSGYSNPSAYSNPGASSGTAAAPAATSPGSAPDNRYPTNPLNQPSGVYNPSTSGAVPTNPVPAPAPPTTAIPTAPNGTPSSSNASPGYSPPGGFKFDNRNGSTWVSPGSSAPASVSLDGATVSAPPESPAGAALDPGPSIVRIPTDGGVSVVPTSAQVPVVPAP
jgi:hypothetical protein